MLFKKGVFKYFLNFTGKYLCWSLFFCEIFKNTFFYRIPPVAAFVELTFQRPPLDKGKIKFQHPVPQLYTHEAVLHYLNRV